MEKQPTSPFINRHRPNLSSLNPCIHNMYLTGESCLECSVNNRSNAIAEKFNEVEFSVNSYTRNADNKVSYGNEQLKTVYIVDDDEIIVYLTGKLIKQENFCEQLETFDNGKTALERLKMAIANHRELPDVMLIDINMPVMDGWEFMNEFVKLVTEKPIPVFIFTSSIDPADRAKSFSYPQIIGHIQKPLNVTKLNKILRLIS